MLPAAIATLPRLVRRGTLFVPPGNWKLDCGWLTRIEPWLTTLPVMNLKPSLGPAVNSIVPVLVSLLVEFSPVSFGRTCSCAPLPLMLIRPALTVESTGGDCSVTWGSTSSVIPAGTVPSSTLGPPPLKAP